MSERERTRAFVAAAAVVAAVAVLLAWVLPTPGGEQSDETARPSADTKRAAPRRATIQDPQSSTRAAKPAAAAGTDRAPAARSPGADEDLPLGTQPPPRPTAAYAAARRNALAFLRVFFRYEVGDLTPELRAAIARLAAPKLARPLLAQPPRPPRSGVVPPPAHVVEVDSVEAGAGGGFDVIALIERAGQRSPLVVTVEPREGRWLATAVG